MAWHLDPRAGAVSQDGRFTAGKEPNVYRDAVRASMTLPGVEEPVVTTGTIIIVDVKPTENVAESVRLARVAIFPERVVLSPGESAQVSIVGVNGHAQGLPNADIRWSVSPPEGGDVSHSLP